MKPNGLLLEYISTEALAMLHQHTEVQIANSPSDAMEIATKLPISAIVTRGTGMVTNQLIQQCQGLKLIARCGVGLDNVDIKSASQQGVKVINAPGSNAASVAEHTLALMLSAQRQIPTYAAAAEGNN